MKYSSPCSTRQCVFLAAILKLPAGYAVWTFFCLLPIAAAQYPLLHLAFESVQQENEKVFFTDSTAETRAELACSMKNQDQLASNPITVTGRKGMGFRAGGNSQYGRFLELSTNLLKGESPFTICFWFKSLASQHSTCLIYYKNNWFSPPGFMLRLDSSLLRLLVVPETGKTALCVASNRPANPIQMNSWYFVTLSRDLQNWTLHLNGEKLTSVCNAPDFVPPNHDIPLRIGGYNIHTNNIFQGILDEFRIYNRTLTTTEILDILQADLQKTGAGKK